MDGRFATLALHTSLIMSSYRQIQAAILNVLLDSHSGKISPLLLNVDQLRKEIAVLQEHMPNSLKLPGNTRNPNILYLYELMNVNSRVEKNKIIFLVHLPLLIKEQFITYSIRPIPQIINNELLVIISTSHYMMVDLHFDKFYLMNNVDFNECKTIGRDDIICKQKHPIFKRQSSMDKCEISLMIGHHEYAENCHLETARDSWIQLKNPNRWIFLVLNKAQINVVCKGTLQQHWIQDCGIIELADDCLIKQDKLEINSHSNFPYNVRQSILPSIKPNLFENATNMGIKQFHIKYRDHNASLENIRSQIQQIKTNKNYHMKSCNIEVGTTPITLFLVTYY